MEDKNYVGQLPSSCKNSCRKFPIITKLMADSSFLRIITLYDKNWGYVLSTNQGIFWHFLQTCPYFSAIWFSKNDWSAQSMQFNFSSRVFEFFSFFASYVVMIKFFDYFWNWKPNIPFSKVFSNDNCLLMRYSVYHSRCFWNKHFGLYQCCYLLVAPLVPEMCLWLVESRKNFNFSRCTWSSIFGPGPQLLFKQK